MEFCRSLSRWLLFTNWFTIFEKFFHFLILAWHTKTNYSITENGNNFFRFCASTSIRITEIVYIQGQKKSMKCSQVLFFFCVERFPYFVSICGDFIEIYYFLFLCEVFNEFKVPIFEMCINIFIHLFIRQIARAHQIRYFG